MLLFIATDVLGYVTCGLWAPLLGSALDVCSLCMYAYSLSIAETAQDTKEERTGV